MANPNGVPGIFGQCIINGIDVTNQIQTMGYDAAFSPRETIVQNSGIHTYITGIHMPALELNGFRNPAANTAWSLTKTAGNTAATDPEYVTAFEMGYGAASADGGKAVLFDGTLITGPGSDQKPDDLLKLPLKFEGRGKYTQKGYRLYEYTTTATTTSSAVDTNPNGYTLPTLGGICMMQVITAFATDTAVVTVTSATTSGGSYSTFATFSSNGSAVGGEWLEVATGTTINRHIKVTVTKTGTSDTPKIRFYFARKWR